MSDAEKENLVLKILQNIQASQADLATRFGELHVRFDGVDQRLKDLEFQNFQVQATMSGIREVATKILSETVALAKRLGAVEKRLEVIEAPKH